MNLKKSFGLSLVIVAFLVWFFSGPFSEQVTTQSGWFLVSIVVLIIVPIFVAGLKSALEFSAGRNLRIISHFSDRDGWKTDLLTDGFASLPKHIFNYTLYSSYELVQVRQHVARRMTDSGQELLAYLEYQYLPHGTEVSRSRFKSGILQLTAIIRKLPGQMPGWVKMAPAWAQPDFFDDIELESHEFNREVYLRSEPEKLATYFSSPNLMAWYLDQKRKPALHAEKNSICIIQRGQITYDDLDRMVTQLQEVTKLVERSGALEKPPKIVLQD